jgi:hypothetical protein
MKKQDPISKLTRAKELKVCLKIVNKKPSSSREVEDLFDGVLCDKKLE